MVRIDDEKKVDEDKTVIKIAAMKEKKTGSRFAHMAQVKGGSDDYVAEAITEDIDTMGGTEVILKTDQEPAMVDLAKTIQVLRKLETVLENSPVGDSQSNGLAEKGIQEIAGQMRVIKLSMEAAYQCRIPINHPIIPWLVEWAPATLDHQNITQSSNLMCIN